MDLNSFESVPAEPLTDDPYLKLEPGGSSTGVDLLPPKRKPRAPVQTAPPVPPPVQGAAFVASQRDPERWAKVMQLADRYHIQPSFADRNFDDLSKNSDQERTVHVASGVSPTLQNWLSDPDNATIGQREVGPLARVDAAAKILAASGQPDESLFGQVKEGAAEYGGMVKDFFSDWGGPKRAVLGFAHGLIDPVETVRRAVLPFRVDETNSIGVPIKGHLAPWGSEGFGNTPLDKYASDAAQVLTMMAGGPVAAAVKATIAEKFGTGLLARAVANLAAEEAVAIPFGAEADTEHPLRGATSMALLAPTLGAVGHLPSAVKDIRARFHADPLIAAGEATVRTNDALRTIHDAQALTEIGQAVKEAKTTASVPGRLRDLVETATGGRDAGTVYFQSGDWDKHWTEAGIDPHTAAADIMGDEGRAYQESKTTGADLAIPLGDYISKVAPTEHWDGLLASARTKPGGMSFREADEYLKALPETMKTLADEAGAEKDFQASDEPAKEVGRNVEQQLIVSGMSPTAARAQALVYEAAFRTLGQRAGVDPLKLYDRYGLNIQRLTPAQATERLKAAQTEAEKTPLTIRDEKGKLRRNLKDVPEEHLQEELGRLIELNASEEAYHSAIQESGYREAYEELPRTERLGARGQEDLPDADGEMDSEVLASHNKTVKEYNRTQVVRAARGKAISRIQDELMRRDPTAFPFGALEQGPRNLVTMKGIRHEGLNEPNQVTLPSDPKVSLNLMPDDALRELTLRAAAAASYSIEVRRDYKALAAALKERTGEVAPTPAEASKNAEARLKLERSADTQRGEKLMKEGWTAKPMPTDGPFAVYDPSGKYMGGSVYPQTEAEAIGRENRPRAFNQPAYHGSPHIFDEFSLHKIGTGEGAQAYGWGLYFSGKKEIAKYYRDELSNHKLLTVRDAQGKILYQGMNVPDGVLEASKWLETGRKMAGEFSHNTAYYAKQAFEKSFARYPEELLKPRNKAVLDQIEALKDAKIGYEVNRGRIYKVDIPNDDTMLHWDKPLSEQPETVRAVLEPLREQYRTTQGTEGPYIADGSTGEEIYRELRQNEVERLAGSRGAAAAAHPTKFQAPAEEAASRQLASLGITGIKYLDGSSRQAGDGSHNYVIFDDKLVKILEYEQALGDGTQSPRGRLVMSDGKQFSIELLAKADKSTFIHETGHLYLEIMGDLAKGPNAAPDIVADHQTIRDWLGAEGDAPLTREQHEQFARGFEAYLMEGKAPSAALRQAFFRFKNWLLDIYKNVRALDVELTPEVREVFDRMLASKEEIEAQEKAQHVTPLFPDPVAAGMSEADATGYLKAVAEARESAEEELTTAMMKQIRREESAEWKAWEEPIRAEVESSVNEEQTYRAMEAIRKGTLPDGTPLPEGTPVLKLNRDQVKAILGEDATPFVRRGFTAADGLDPDIVAEMFGFGSGDEMVNTLAKSPSRKQAIEEAVSARMQSEHGERMSPSDILDKATQALHGEKRAIVLRKELEHLMRDNPAALKKGIRAITKVIPPDEVIQRQAREILGRKVVREIRPDLYEKAATRAGREALEAMLKGDQDTAFALKSKERLLTEVYRAAVDAKAGVEDSLDGFKEMFRSDAKLAKTRDMDLVNAARAVLASFGIGSSDKPASAYLEAIRQYDPDGYEVLKGMVDAATETAHSVDDYKALPYDDFVALNETVQSLWNLSRRDRQIEIDGQRLERDVVRGELSARIEEIAGPDVAARAGYEKAATKWEKTKMSLMGARAALRRVEHWVDAMDSGNPLGVFRKYIWNGVSEAASEFRVQKRAFLEKYLELTKLVRDDLRHDKIAAPEIGYTFDGTKELLGTLLHVGNKSNLRKLLAGRGWGTIRADGSLDTVPWQAFVDRMHKEGTLTKAHYDFVQGVWHLFDEMKAGAQKAHKEMYGHYFSEVTADAFSTPFGEYPGGYAPAKADPFMVADQAVHQEREALLGSGNSFMFPTTGKGFTKARVEYNAPLVIDIGFVPSHIDAVLRFTHIEPRVRDVGRLIMGRDFTKSLDAFDPTVRGDMLVPWLQRAASQLVNTPSKGRAGKALDGFFRELRTRTGLQIMTANVVNALQQVTQISASAVKVAPKSLGSALWRYVRAPKEVAEGIAEKSAFMRTRQSAQVMEVQKAIDNLLFDPSKYEKVEAFGKEHGYFLSSGAQSIVDKITWLGAYDEAVGKGFSERDAVRISDSAVRETQGSFSAEDVSRFETGAPFMRAFSMFYSFFNMQANLLGTEFLNATRGIGLRKGAGRLLFVYTAAFMIPAVLSGELYKLASGRPFDEDDDGPWDDVLGLFFGSQVDNALRMVPIAGPIASFAINKFTGSKPYNDHISASAAIQKIEQAVSVPADVYHAIREKTIRKQDIVDFFTLVGMMTGLPVAPLAKPIGYLRDIQTGKAQPSGAVDFTRGLITGQAGKK